MPRSPEKPRLPEERPRLPEELEIKEEVSEEIEPEPEPEEPEPKRKEEKEIMPIRCPNCGKTVRSIDNYCVYCGEKLRKEEVEEELDQAEKEVKEAFEEPEEEK